MSRKVLLVKRKLSPSDIQSPEAPLKYLNQAERIIRKFGGATRLARILGLIGKPTDVSTINRWKYPPENGGTGGLIPTCAWSDVFQAARADGVVILSEDLDPRMMPWEGRERDFVLRHPGEVFDGEIDLKESKSPDGKKPRKRRPRGVPQKLKDYVIGRYTPPKQEPELSVEAFESPKAHPGD